MASARTCSAWSEGRAEAGVGRGFITYQCISVLIHYAATQHWSITGSGAGRTALQVVQRGPPGLEGTWAGSGRRTGQPGPRPHLHPDRAPGRASWRPLLPTRPARSVLL